MAECTYDIIDYKSCESYSPSDSSEDKNRYIYRDRQGTEVYTRSKDDICSTIVFPKLFHERQSETSIVTMPDDDDDDAMLDDGPLFYNELLTKDAYYEESSVYQKVANWVYTQRKYFRHIEPSMIEDDEMEVIDPVDLFHESILNDYLLITEDESERRFLLRDFIQHRYHIESIQEAMKINDYRFLREPNKNIDIELVKIIDFHKFHNPINPKHVRKRRDSLSTEGIPCLSCSSESSSPDQTEEQLNFLGVPRLLENYTILNREGYIIKEDGETDLWLAPLETGYVVEGQEKDDGEDLDLDFISSWFSDVYQTDINTDEVRTFITTDILEKATVISVSCQSEEEIFLDAPDIPHWFDDEQEELELFNQPSRPLYYYRDRIKGCYRIIGVEDETVVLFSGNDDDTIFYPGDEVANSSRQSWSDGDTRPSRRQARLIRSDSDRKNDSGIEDVDDIIQEDVAIASISILSDSVTKVKHSTGHKKQEKNVRFNVNVENSLLEISIVVFSAIVLFLTVFMFNPDFKDGVLYWVDNDNKINDLFTRMVSKLKNITSL